MIDGEDLQARAGVREGAILAGKYRVERVLGAGGMGVVVAAYHEQLQERVALKFLLPGMLADDTAVSRFLREARAAAKIKSEHVARVFDVGTLETGAPYIVMEFLEGGDLGARLRQRGPLSIEEAVDFVLQACVAIAEAHGLGIVHRDLKPANLFCLRRPDGQPAIKVLDFGISKMAGQPGSTGGGVTKTAAIMGSPFYMSPEQMRSSRDVDLRTDIWALGVILYELATGQVPFPGESITEIAIHVATRPTPPLRALLPGASPGFEAVIARCLEKDRDARYRRVADLARALVPFGSKRALSSIDRISGLTEGVDTLPLPSHFQSELPSSALAHGAGDTGAPVGRTMDAGAPGMTRVPGGGARRARTLGFALAALVGGSIVVASGLWFATRSTALPAHAHDPSEAPGSGAPPPASVSAPPASASVLGSTPHAPSVAPAGAADPLANGERADPATSSDPSKNAQTARGSADAGAGAAPSGPAGGPAGAHHGTEGAPPPNVPPLVVRNPNPINPINPASTASAAVVVKPRAVDCTVPFFIDPQGHRVPKPECL